MRSQTDEQLAARWDDAPWELPETKGRARTRRAAAYEFAPRIECIPSRDPLPYVDPATGNQLDAGAAQTERYYGRVMEWAPRPEFARPPVNLVLVHFRAQLSPVIPLRLHVRGFLNGITRLVSEGFSIAEIEHARKVLMRLARVTA